MDKKIKAEEELKEEEISAEENQASVEVEVAPDERDQQIAELSAELQSARENMAKLTNMLQQLQADFDNFRKRNASATSEAKEKGVFEAVKTLLPAFDAVIVAEKQIDDPKTLEGLAMVERQLNTCLETLGITPIESVGSTFDPNLHNAVYAEEKEGVEANIVLEEFSKGYKSEAGVVRFATVKISK